MSDLADPSQPLLEWRITTAASQARPYCTRGASGNSSSGLSGGTPWRGGWPLKRAHVIAGSKLFAQASMPPLSFPDGRGFPIYAQ